MTWDLTKPAGDRNISLGDDDIREFKTDVEAALEANDATLGDAGVMPGASAAAPKYHYRGHKGTTAQKPSAGNYGLYFNTDTEEIERDNGSAWQQVGINFASGTDMVFYQASAPTGWTINTSINDRILLIDSAAGGTTGGSWATLGVGTLQFQVAEYDFQSGAGDSKFEFYNSGGTAIDVFSKGWTNPFSTDQDGVKLIPADSNATYYTSNGTGATGAHGSTQHNWAKVIVCSKD